MPNLPLSPGGNDRYGRGLGNVADELNQCAQVPTKVGAYRLLPLEPADDPDSGLFGFVGPEGLIGLFALPPIVEPPMVEPLIVEPLPEGEGAVGLPVKPGEVDPEVLPEGLPGAVVASPAAPGAVPAPPIAAPPPAPPAAPPPPPCA